jgi:hypothetical protein
MTESELCPPGPYIKDLIEKNYSALDLFEKNVFN